MVRWPMDSPKKHNLDYGSPSGQRSNDNHMPETISNDHLLNNNHEGHQTKEEAEEDDADEDENKKAEEEELDFDDEEWTSIESIPSTEDILANGVDEPKDDLPNSPPIDSGINASGVGVVSEGQVASTVGIDTEETSELAEAETKEDEEDKEEGGEDEKENEEENEEEEEKGEEENIKEDEEIEDEKEKEDEEIKDEKATENKEIEDEKETEDEETEDEKETEDEEEEEVECKGHTHLERESVNMVISMPLETVFKCMFTDNPFFDRITEQQGTFDITQSSWPEEANENGEKERIIYYTVRLNNAIGPKTSPTTETQVLLSPSYPDDERRQVTVDAEVRNTGVPYCDCFHIINRYCLSRRSAKRTGLLVTSSLVYDKSLFFPARTLIESAARRGFCGYFDLLHELLKEEEASHISIAPAAQLDHLGDELKCVDDQLIKLEVVEEPHDDVHPQNDSVDPYDDGKQTEVSIQGQRGSSKTFDNDEQPDVDLRSHQNSSKVFDVKPVDQSETDKRFQSSSSNSFDANNQLEVDVHLQLSSSNKFDSDDQSKVGVQPQRTTSSVFDTNKQLQSAEPPPQIDSFNIVDSEDQREIGVHLRRRASSIIRDDESTAIFVHFHDNFSNVFDATVQSEIDVSAQRSSSDTLNSNNQSQVNVRLQRNPATVLNANDQSEVDVQLQRIFSDLLCEIQVQARRIRMKYPFLNLLMTPMQSWQRIIALSLLLCLTFAVIYVKFSCANPSINTLYSDQVGSPGVHRLYDQIACGKRPPLFCTPEDWTTFLKHQNFVHMNELNRWRAVVDSILTLTDVMRANLLSLRDTLDSLEKMRMSSLSSASASSASPFPSSSETV